MAGMRRHALNVIGPFYVEDGCCTGCGITKLYAAEMFGEDGTHHCYVKRQPAGEAETDAMVRTMTSQDFWCIRYEGEDPEVLRRLAEAGHAEQCDVPVEIDPVRRDHVTFVGRSTARSILERLLGYPEGWDATPIEEVDDTSASVSVSWCKGPVHRIEAFGMGRDRWLVRHHGPPTLAHLIHDWLKDMGFEDLRWQSKAQWEREGPWQPTPW